MKNFKKTLLILFAVLTALMLLAFSACGEKENAGGSNETPSGQTPGGNEGSGNQGSGNQGEQGGGNEPAETFSYTVTVLLPGGAAVAELSVSLLPEEGEALTATTDEEGAAKWEGLAPGAYGVQIGEEDFPYGYTFDNEKYAANVGKEESALTVSFDYAAGAKDFSAHIGNWESIDGTTFLVEVEADGVFFNGEEVDAVSGEEGLSFQNGGVSYMLAAHPIVEGAKVLRFAEHEEFMLPEEGLDRVSVPEMLEGTWMCTEIEGTYLIFDGSNFSFSVTEDLIDDGYVIAAVPVPVEEGADAADYQVVAVILSGENIGVYTMSYSWETGYITVSMFDTSVTFWKSGFGNESDPTIIEQFVGDYSATITTQRIQVGFMETYYFLPTYYAYTPAEDNETYTLWNPNCDNPDYQLSLIIYTGSIEEGDAVILVDWVSNIPESYFESFTLQKGQTYLLQVGVQPGDSKRPIAGVTVSFSIAQGENPPVQTAEIPAIYHGTWYNEANKQETVIFERRRAIWNGELFSVTAADAQSLTGDVGGEEVVFTLEGATLKAQKGGQTLRFTLISGQRPAIATVFAGFYVNDKDPSDLIVIEGATHNADGDVLTAGSFLWAAHDAEVAAAQLTDLILVIDDEIWVASMNGSTVTLAKRSGGAETVFRKCDGISSFASAYRGDFSGTLGGTAVSLTVGASSVSFNGKTVEVWQSGGVFYFVAEGKAYSFAKEDGGVLLTDLSSKSTSNSAHLTAK